MYLINPDDVFPNMEEDFANYFKNVRWDLIGFFPCQNENYNWISTNTLKGSVIPVYVFYGKKCCGPDDWFFDCEDYKNPSEYIIENPWILMFYGCDNTSYGMRFKEKHHAIIFLNNLEYVDFADFFRNFSDPKLGEHRLRWWNS